jgi:SPP1 gp7 family putative phage head morphogenesis protein
MRGGTADSYADGTQAMLRDLEMNDTLAAFSSKDADNLRFIYQSFAAHPIKTFQGQQLELIEQAIADAYTTGDSRNLYDIRNKVEQNWTQLSTKETNKLDRIVRTSTHQAGCKARGQAFRDSGLQEVRLFTANDGNVRPSHKQYHGQVIPLALAEQILMDINCRCRMTKAARHPKTVPSPDVLAAAIGAENMSARQQAYAALQEAA